MNVNPITFGKAIKINTSKEVAEKILANRNNSQNAVQNSFLKSILGETKNEDTAVYQVKKKESYIFTDSDAFAARSAIEPMKENSFFYNMLVDCAYEATEEKGELTVLKYKENVDNVIIKKAKYNDKQGTELSFSTIG